jgi:RHS repeat-associated protein
MQMEGLSAAAVTQNAYQYNGIERNTDFGLNLDLAVFRTYDPSIGRWIQVDPLSEIAPELNGYRNAFNNPVNFVDPLGLFETRREAREYRRDNDIKGMNKGVDRVNGVESGMILFTVSKEVSKFDE